MSTKSLKLLARLAGFEPATYGFVVIAFELHTISNASGNRGYSPKFNFQKKGNFPDFWSFFKKSLTQILTQNISEALHQIQLNWKVCLFTILKHAGQTPHLIPD